LIKLEYICLVGSLALIGADRVDLFWGHGFFRLTPFLLFASLVVLIRLLVMGLREGFQVAISPPFRRQIPYVVVLALFLFLAFTSTILGEDPQRGLVALCGLVLVSGLGYCVSARILADPAPEKLVVRSITVALIVWLIFCIGGAIAWSHGETVRLQEEASTSIESMFAPTATLFWIPRLSGFCLDANRAGFILVMYLALLDRFGTKTRYTRFLRFVIACFIFIAVSRSAMLCWITYYLFSSGFWKRLSNPRAVFKVATLAIVCLLVGLAYRQEIADLAELGQLTDIVSDRLSSDPGSTAGSHFELIQRGFATWTTSTRTVVGGIGFAGAYRVLGDFFGDVKYANFHDLYVSVLAELGLPAFLLLMVLLGYPMIGRKGAASWIAAIAIFNVFLQSFLEPIFWVALALAWSFELQRYIPRNLGSGDIAAS
jgi:hypothetical protein